MGAFSAAYGSGADVSLSRYLQEIRRYPMLAPEEEYNLAKRYLDEGDERAAERLVTSHLRLVAKIAMGYRGYGLPLGELIGEGNIGMMHAVKRFDPDRGFRLATYAMWWIRAAIQEYILHSWSLVKMGTTAAQKKLFFNLRRIKARMQALDEGDLAPEIVTQDRRSARCQRGRGGEHEQAHGEPRPQPQRAGARRRRRTNGKTGWWMSATTRRLSWRGAKRAARASIFWPTG